MWNIALVVSVISGLVVAERIILSWVDPP